MKPTLVCVNKSLHFCQLTLHSSMSHDELFKSNLMKLTTPSLMVTLVDCDVGESGCVKVFAFVEVAAEDDDEEEEEDTPMDALAELPEEEVDDEEEED